MQCTDKSTPVFQLLNILQESRDSTNSYFTQYTITVLPYLNLSKVKMAKKCVTLERKNFFLVKRNKLERLLKRLIFKIFLLMGHLALKIYTKTE